MAEDWRIDECDGQPPESLAEVSAAQADAYSLGASFNRGKHHLNIILRQHSQQLHFAHPRLGLINIAVRLALHASAAALRLTVHQSLLLGSFS